MPSRRDTRGRFARDAGAALAKGITEVVEATVRTVAAAAYNNLYLDTPVDTGYARENWIPSVGSPSTRIDGQPGQRGVFGSHTAKGALASAGLAQVAKWKLGRGRIYITNNLPYINRLDAGWSQQAPAGFVQRAINRALLMAGANMKQVASAISGSYGKGRRRR